MNAYETLKLGLFLRARPKRCIADISPPEGRNPNLECQPGVQSDWTGGGLTAAIRNRAEKNLPEIFFNYLDWFGFRVSDFFRPSASRRAVAPSQRVGFRIYGWTGSCHG
jgi:hypothetical protein